MVHVQPLSTILVLKQAGNADMAVCHHYRPLTEHLRKPHRSANAQHSAHGMYHVRIGAQHRCHLVRASTVRSDLASPEAACTQASQAAPRSSRTRFYTPCEDSGFSALAPPRRLGSPEPVKLKRCIRARLRQELNVDAESHTPSLQKQR